MCGHSILKRNFAFKENTLFIIGKQLISCPGRGMLRLEMILIQVGSEIVCPGFLCGLFGRFSRRLCGINFRTGIYTELTADRDYVYCSWTSFSNMKAVEGFICRLEAQSLRLGLRSAWHSGRLGAENADTV